MISSWRAAIQSPCGWSSILLLLWRLSTPHLSFYTAVVITAHSQRGLQSIMTHSRIWKLHWILTTPCSWQAFFPRDSVLIYIPFFVSQLSIQPWVNCYSHLATTVCYEFETWNKTTINVVHTRYFGLKNLLQFSAQY